MRTCREMGMPTVAVYAEPDARAPHTYFADERVALAGPSPRLSPLVEGRRAPPALLPPPGPVPATAPRPPPGPAAGADPPPPSPAPGRRVGGPGRPPSPPRAPRAAPGRASDLPAPPPASC